jgi:hypothetical protein
MPFQTQVNLYPAPGIPGVQASANPVYTVDAGTGALVAATGGLTVANFAWISGTTNLGGGVASNASTTAPIVPDGFVMNSHEALITTWLGQATMVIPQGVQCTLAQRGDFWATSNYGAAVRGQKVFAHVFNGNVLIAAAGTFPANLVGSNASITASVATSVLTVTAVASGVLAVGQLVQGVNIPAGTYILSLGTGTGGTGTYNLTTTPGTVVSGTITTVSVGGLGGAVASSVSIPNGSATLTVTTLTSGVVAVGMYVQPIAGIPAGTYILSLGTGTGGTGTYTLSANATATVTTQAANFSPWIETPWSALSDGNPGDLIKIGIKN